MEAIEDRAFDLRAMAVAIVPAVQGDEAVQAEIIENFKQLFADLDVASQKKVLLFFRVLLLLSFLRGFQDWRRMTLEDRQRFFLAIESFPVGLIRAGFFGLRSLLLLAYYGTSSAWQRIGYEGPIVQRSIHGDVGSQP